MDGLTMTIIPKGQIDEENYRRAAFSTAADEVIALSLSIRKTTSHIAFRCSAIEVGELENGEQKDALNAALSNCQALATSIELDFALWQQFELGDTIDERAREEEEEPEP